MASLAPPPPRTTSSSVSISEQDAWAIATAWQDELQGRVKLIVDPAVKLGFDIVHRYEWVQFDFSGSSRDYVRPVENPLRLAAYARVASVIWLALSRCAGYSGRENPVFWKRVMSELNLIKIPFQKWMIAGGVKTDYFESVTDAIRFFDKPDHEFPQFALRLQADPYRTDKARSSDESIARVFCGLDEYQEDDEQRNAQLTDILRQLAPFYVQPDRQSQLALDCEDPVIVANLNVALTTDSIHCPRRPLLYGDRARQRSADQQYRDLHQLFGLSGSAPPQQNATSANANATLKLYRNDLEDNSFEALMAMLPLSRTIENVIFTTYHSPMIRNTEPDFTESDWAFLGFALFHPDAATSRWRKLKIDLGEISASKQAALAKMARGNNLLSCGGDDSGCDAYYTASLTSHTTVFAQPNGTSDHQLAVLSAAPTTVDLCGVASCDPATYGTWVCAVVPGAGLGWIQTQAIAQVTARPPCVTPFLTHLQLGSVELDGKYPDESLLPTLSSIGANLESLDIDKRGPVTSDTLRLVLASCPKLISLTAQHDGSLWMTSDLEETANWPRLQNLELVLSERKDSFKEPSTVALACSLSELRALRISTMDAHIADSRDAIVSFLGRHPRLEYFNWNHRWAPVYLGHGKPNGVIPYEEDRQRTRKLFMAATATDTDPETMDHFEQGSVAMGLGPLSGAQRMAFLSAIQHKQLAGALRCRGAMRRLDRGVLELVFAFGSTPFVRQLCLFA